MGRRQSKGYYFSFVLNGLGNSNIPVVLESKAGSSPLRVPQLQNIFILVTNVYFSLEDLLSVRSLPGKIYQRDQGPVVGLASISPKQFIASSSRALSLYCGSTLLIFNPMKGATKNSRQNIFTLC